MALTETQQEIQVCENKPGKNSMAVKKVKMDEMRLDIGVKESSKKKLVRSTWAGHVDKMGDEKWASH